MTFKLEQWLNAHRKYCAYMAKQANAWYSED